MTDPDPYPTAYAAGKRWRKAGGSRAGNPFHPRLMAYSFRSWNYGYDCQARGERIAEAKQRKREMRQAA